MTLAADRWAIQLVIDAAWSLSIVDDLELEIDRNTAIQHARSTCNLAAEYLKGKDESNG